MAWLRQLWNVLRQDRGQRDLDRELSFHVTERAEELQSGGMSEQEALRTALLQFGNYTTQVERTRDMDVNDSLEALIRNFRQAVRGLRRAPAFTITVLATLALGIGANSAVFSAINAVLLRPLPFPDAGQLVMLSQIAPLSSKFVAPVRLEEWNRLNSTLQAITGYYTQDDSELSGELPEKLRRALVAPRFLKVWGVSPRLGRNFTPEEERFGGPDAVLISDRLWRRRFGETPWTAGKTLRFGNAAVPIIGVMPKSFLFADRDVDLWSVSAPDAPFAQNRTAEWFTAIGRLKPGVTLAQARADLARVQANLARQFPKPDSTISSGIEPLKTSTVGGVGNSLWILFGAVTLLLLIACINVAALILSRATGRRHEIALRFSLGGSRASVAAQLLTEVLILALGGAGLGLIMAAAAAKVFRTLARDMPRVEEIGLDGRIVLYSLFCAVAATLVCGLLPALRATRRSLSGSMAGAGRSQVSARNPVQFALVGVQVALAVSLLAGAGLLVRSFQALGQVSPGFDPEHVLTFHISSSWGETGNQQASAQRTERILKAVLAVPGVEAAATSFSLPGVRSEYEIEVASAEGRAGIEPKMLAQTRLVTPGYFATLSIPLLAGELCRTGSATASMMVNRSFANTYLGGTTAIGHHLLQPGNTYVQPSAILGIVGDARELGMDSEPRPAVYWCASAIQPGTYFLIRTRDDPSSMAETIRRKIHEVEPRRSVYGISPLRDHISDAYAEHRLRTILLAFFAITAVSLASVGLYGTLSYMVNIRRREVGLRLALGAVRGQIVRQFLAQGLRVSVLGCVAGLALAAVFTRLLSGMLFGVSAWDALTMTGVIALVLVVSSIASLLPAIRAARVEPMKVLRDE